jgi:hypothetical protein
MKAAPQLAHLLLIIISCVALFACLAFVGSGDRVAHYSSYGTAFEETLRSLLGLGYVQKRDIFPGTVWQPFPQLLLNVLIYYGREMLFVLVLMQFFMTTLGAVFMELKYKATRGKPRSIGQDIMQDIWPEVKALGKCLVKGKKYSTVSRDINGAAVEVPVSTTSLQSFLKAHYPHLAVSKSLGDSVKAIPIGDKYLDVELFQQLLLAQLSVDGNGSNNLLMRTGPAKRYTRQATKHNAVATASSSSDAGTPAASVDLLPELGRAAVDAGAAGAAVAAALAIVDQLMATCGRSVNMDNLEAAKLSLQQLVGHAADSDEYAAAVFKDDQDFTVEVRINIVHGTELGAGKHASMWH